LEFLDHAVDQRFISELHRGLLLSDDDPTVLIDRMMAYQVPNTGKWLDRDTS